MRYNDVTVIIPTFNEEKNIGVLIKKLSKLFSNIKIIVSDDGSKDRTQEVVVECTNENVTLLDRSKKPVKGLTVSVMDAIVKCKTEFFVVIDADFQHPPNKIKEIIDKLREDNDLVIGNRIKIHGDWGVHRLIISETAYFLGNLRLLKKKFPKSDLMSGFFGAKTKLVNEIMMKNHKKFELKGYKILFDIMKYLSQDSKVNKVDYEFGLRTRGESKLDWKIMYYYFRSLFKWYNAIKSKKFNPLHNKYF